MWGRNVLLRLADGSNLQFMTIPTRHSRFAAADGTGRGSLRPAAGSMHAIAVVFGVSLVFAVTNHVSSPARLAGEQARSPMASEPTLSRSDRADQYAWLSRKQRVGYEPLIDRMAVPAGFNRVGVAEGSFAEWLRHLPVAPVDSPVKSAKGRVILAAGHPNLAAVVVLQPHMARLLSAGNMLIRLRGEYCWSAGQTENLSFHFMSGQRYAWQAWMQGVRTVLRERKVVFRKTDSRGCGRADFCQYLETVFRYASTYSLLDDTRRVEDGAIGIGDILLRPGRPGHAMLVVDVATNADGDVRILLGEGGMPVQTFHILQSDADNPWFPFSREGKIDLAGRGGFEMEHLRRWAQ